jgi:hypothetical protein
VRITCIQIQRTLFQQVMVAGMKEECKKCICNECMSQSTCEKSCKLCETLLGSVTYCKNERRCEQLELFSEE